MIFALVLLVLLGETSSLESSDCQISWKSSSALSYIQNPANTLNVPGALRQTLVAASGFGTGTEMCSVVSHRDFGGSV
jgi:hypothetical protein